MKKLLGVAVLSALLGTSCLTPAFAGSHSGGVNRNSINAGNYAMAQDTDPLCDGSSSTHDCSDALNRAAAIVSATSGKQVNVHPQAGNYYLTKQVNLTRGQILSGDGRGNTNFLIDQAFDPAAVAIIGLSGGGLDQGPQVRDLNISCAQPSDQGVRANFAAVGVGTSGLGGTGVKYPAAIKALTNSSRYMVSNVRIAGCWDGIDSNGINAVWFIDNLECGTLDVCLTMAGSLDFVHIKGFHFWDFGISNSSALYTGVFTDGLNFAAKFGRMDTVSVEDWSSFHGRTQIDSPSFVGEFVNVQMDSSSATFEVVSNLWTHITNMYSTVVPDGVNDTKCPIDLGVGNRNTMISHWQSEGPSTGTISALCVAGGVGKLSDSWIKGNKVDLPSILLTGGTLTLHDNSFIMGNGWTAPVVLQTAGALVATGNDFPTTGTNAGSIKITTDVAGNYIADNRLNPWPLVFDTFPTTTVLGYYDLGDQPITLTMTPTFAVPGDYAPTSVSSTGTFFMRGDWVDFHTSTSWSNNLYTTASGDFQLTSNMPKPVLTDYGCSIFLMNNFTTTFTPGCGVSAGSTNAYVRFSSVSTGAVSSNFSTTQSPVSKAAMAVRLSGRYRIR